MSVLDRATLEASSLADLHAIASELSLDGYRRLRKSDLIDRLVAHQEGRETGTDESTETAEGAEPEEGTGAARRRRGRRGGRSRAGAARDQEGEESEGTEAPEAEEPEAAEEKAPEAKPTRSRRGAKKPAEETEKPEQTERAAKPARGAKPAKEEVAGEAEVVEGVVELLANGSGFLRLSAPETSDDDVYISAAQVKRCELVTGDRVSGPRRAPHRSERYPSLIRIDSVNGKPAAELADRGRFDDLPTEFPKDRFKLGSDDATLKAIEFLTPFGRGSRVTITGERWSGKSHALRLLAAALLEQKGVTVLAALAGVRPEELAEWASGPVAPTAAVSFAASTDAQDHAVELVVDQAKRLAARGEDAIVLIDTLDGLQPLTARKVLAAARNITDGGSLTVIATASAPLGGETTVINLDASLVRLAKYPALDLAASGTIRPELLVGKTAANAIVKERAKALK